MGEEILHPEIIACKRTRGGETQMGRAQDVHGMGTVELFLHVGDVFLQMCGSEGDVQPGEENTVVKLPAPVPV